MGVVMITGMVISTIVTLFFTPVCYSMLDSLASAVTGPALRPLREENGSISSSVPNTMIPRNVRAMTRLMLTARRLLLSRTAFF